MKRLIFVIVLVLVLFSCNIQMKGGYQYQYPNNYLHYYKDKIRISIEFASTANCYVFRYVIVNNRDKNIMNPNFKIIMSDGFKKQHYVVNLPITLTPRKIYDNYYLLCGYFIIDKAFEIEKIRIKNVSWGE
jgi:hypothetical protein